MPMLNAQVVGFSVAIAILVTGLLLLVILMVLIIVKKTKKSKEAIQKGGVHVHIITHLPLFPRIRQEGIINYI